MFTSEHYDLSKLAKDDPSSDSQKPSNFGELESVPFDFASPSFQHTLMGAAFQLENIEKPSNVSSLEILKDFTSRSRKVNVELLLTLLISAEKTGQRHFDHASKLIDLCNKLSSSEGNTVERLVYYFSEGIREKINREMGKVEGEGLDTMNMNNLQRALISVDTGILAFHQKQPLFQVCEFSAMQTIIEHVKGARKVHVIDLEIRCGMQYTVLMQSLKSQCGWDIECLKITAVGTRLESNLKDICNCLADFAKSMNIPFSFKVVMATNILYFRKDLLELDDDAKIAIHSPYFLSTLIVKPNRLEHLMREIRKINPCITLISEIEANHTSPVFVTRFIEALFFYGALFDGVSDCSADDYLNRKVSESVFYGQPIRNIVAAEGDERTCRHDGKIPPSLFLPGNLYNVTLSVEWGNLIRKIKPTLKSLDNPYADFASPPFLHMIKGTESSQVACQLTKVESEEIHNNKGNDLTTNVRIRLAGLSNDEAYDIELLLTLLASTIRDKINREMGKVADDGLDQKMQMIDLHEALIRASYPFTRDLPDFSNDNHLLNYVLQHQVHVKESSADSPSILFKIYNHYLHFGREEFCLVAGFRCGELSELVSDKIPYLDRLFREKNKKTMKASKEIVFMGREEFLNVPLHIFTFAEDFFALEFIFMGRDSIPNLVMLPTSGELKANWLVCIDYVKAGQEDFPRLENVPVDLIKKQDCTLVEQAKKPTCSTSVRLDAVRNQDVPLVQETQDVLENVGSSYKGLLEPKLMDTVDLLCKQHIDVRPEMKGMFDQLKDTQPSTMEHLVNACAFVSPLLPFFDSLKPNKFVEPAQVTSVIDDYMDIQNDPYCLDNMTIGIGEDTQNGKLTVSLFAEQIANENNHFDKLLKDGNMDLDKLIADVTKSENKFVLQRHCKSNPSKVTVPTSMKSFLRNGVGPKQMYKFPWVKYSLVVDERF
nr:hypothetical protein [Tanacetum cinerariifolium]